MTVRVDIQNIGKRDGAEVAQLYVNAQTPGVKRPTEELRGFEPVSLKAGQKKTVTFVVPGDNLAFWDENRRAFVVDPGKVDVLVGASSADIRLRDQFEVLP